MTKKLILGFTGEAGSGKDAAAQYLHEKYGAYVRTFSTPLRDLLERLYLPVTRAHLSRLSLALRREFGEELFGHVVMGDVSESEHPFMVITGIRREEDMIGLTRSPDFHLVYIEASPKARFDRIRGRGQNEDDMTKTFEEFLKESELETERRIRAMKEKAEVTIVNEGTVDDLYQKLDTLMKTYA